MKNGNGNDKDSNKKVVHLPTLKERDQARREAEKAERRAQIKANPMINLPESIKYLLGALIVIHVVLAFLPDLQIWVVENLGFTPGQWTGRETFTLYTPLTLLTHMFLHGSWMHLGMNAVMLAAFGTGIEKWLGARRMVIFLCASGLCGVGFHFILNPFSTGSVIGISGALSGFFAAILIMMKRGFLGGGQQRILPFAILWIVISVAFGIFGSPGLGNIAWAAHVGGFLGGFAVLKLMRV